MIDANIEIDIVIIYISKQNWGLNKKTGLCVFFYIDFINGNLLSQIVLVWAFVKIPYRTNRITKTFRAMLVS